MPNRAHGESKHAFLWDYNSNYRVYLSWKSPKIHNKILKIPLLLLTEDSSYLYNIIVKNNTLLLNY